MSSFKKIFLALFLSVFLFSTSCNKIKNDGIIKKDKFAHILSDMMTIQYLKINDQQKKVLFNSVLKKYQVTQAQFEKTRKHYAQNPVFWEDIFKRTRNSLEKKNIRRKNKK